MPVAADLEVLDRGLVERRHREARVARRRAGEQALLQRLGDVALCSYSRAVSACSRERSSASAQLGDTRGQERACVRAGRAHAAPRRSPRARSRTVRTSSPLDRRTPRSRRRPPARVSAERQRAVTRCSRSTRSRAARSRSRAPQQLALVLAALRGVEDRHADQPRLAGLVALAATELTSTGSRAAVGADDVEAISRTLPCIAQQRRVVRLVVDPAADGQQVLEARRPTSSSRA